MSDFIEQTEALAHRLVENESRFYSLDDISAHLLKCAARIRELEAERDIYKETAASGVEADIWKEVSARINDIVENQIPNIRQLELSHAGLKQRAEKAEAERNKYRMERDDLSVEVGRRNIRICELEAERDTWMKVAAGAGNAEIFARERAEKAKTEIIQLRAHLEEADELLEVAYYAHQKMGLEGEGNRRHSHEVRMFAMHFSQPETPQSPQHVILSGDGRYWRFRLRDMPAKPGSPSVPSPNQPPPAALDPAVPAVKAPPAAIHKDKNA